MTGYGRGESILFNRRFVVEIKSVNHRYNDISIKLPRIINSFEDKIRKNLNSEIYRGKTDVYISFESFSKDDFKIKMNEAIADSYIEALLKIKEKYGLQDEITLSLVSKFPDLILVEKNSEDEKALDEIWQCLEQALKISITKFVNMRSNEGETLKDDILKKLENIKMSMKKVSDRAPFVAKEYAQKLTDRINEAVKDINIDESRLISEIVIFSDKTCIDEEITRLYSHISQMAEILEEAEPIGRKLDFLVQEMNREVNTIGSKSNDIEITKETVLLKSEVEKIREQVQNIE